MNLTRKQILMLIVLVFGTFITVLNQTVVTPALPSIMTEMSIDAATAQWLTTGFTLVNAIMIPITAYLTDKYSTKRLFIVAMSIFTTGSLLAGWGPSFPVLLIGRLLQAGGAGILMPMVMTVLMLTFPVEKRGTAMGIFGLVIAFGPAIGPTVAGIVIDHATWHIMFFAISILAAIVIVLSTFLMDGTAPANSGKATLDKTSVVLSSLGFGSLLYGFSVIGSYGISIGAIISTIVGVIALVFFFRRQLHMEHPMLQVRILKNRTFLVGTIIGMLVQASLLAAGILLPIYIQSYLGYSATISGLVIMPGAIVMGAMGPIAGRLFDKYGPRMLSLVGLVILTLSTFAFAFLGDSTSVTYLTILYTVRLFSLSLVNMPITTWAMNSLDDKLVNHGNALNNTFRQVAGSLGTAVLVSVMTITAGGAMATTDYVHANIFGINVAFAVAGFLCMTGLVLTIIFVRNKPSQAAEADPDNARRTVLESIMKHDVFTLSPDASVLDAMKLMVQKTISAAPLVTDDGRAVGFISDGDIMRFLSKRTQVYMDPVVMIMQTDAMDECFDDKLKNLMSMKVRDIATKGVISVNIHDNLSDVCRVLGENHLKKVPVMDEGKVAGVINRTDITQYSMKQYLDSQATA